MTIVSLLSFLTSFIGVLGFACWDNDIEVPVLYPFGSFLGQFWFHDFGGSGKIRASDFPQDGAPMVFAVGTGGPIPFPYPSDVNDSTDYSLMYDTSKRMSQTDNTPVDGMYGVTSVKPSTRNKNLVYVPNAVPKNDYIAKRMLGDHANWMDLNNMNQKEIYNDKVFKDGNPFTAAKIGPNNQDDPRWSQANYGSSVAGMPFQPPLTSTAAIGYSLPDQMGKASISDYSGFEYNDGDNTSLEAQFCSAPRPFTYQTDSSGNPINSDKISAYPLVTWQPSVNIGTLKPYILPSFYDKNFTGAMTINGLYGTIKTPWGVPTSNDGKYISGYKENNTLDGMQYEYVETMLSQENPISKLGSQTARRK